MVASFTQFLWICVNCGRAKTHIIWHRKLIQRDTKSNWFGEIGKKSLMLIYNFETKKTENWIIIITWCRSPVPRSAQFVNFVPLIMIINPNIIMEMYFYYHTQWSHQFISIRVRQKLFSLIALNFCLNTIAI